MKKYTIAILICFFIFSFFLPVYAVDVSQIQKTTEDIAKERALIKRIEKKPPKTKIEDELPAPTQPTLPEEKVMIKKINVTGVTLIPQAKISSVITPYQNKEVSLRELQRLADVITDIYRKKGYITSRAYLPPQKIQEGILEIRVVEGITGTIEVKGNKYFKSSLYRKRINLEKGQPFNYERLREGLSRINDLADRYAKAVLVPGKEPGTTDIVLEAKDQLPLHVGFDWDNFGSRYIDKNRFRVTLTDNNLLGLDDIFTFSYQQGERDTFYKLFLARYLIPVTDTLKIGFMGANSKMTLQKEFTNTGTRSKSKIYNLYATQSLIENENVNLDLNLGFDYKDIFNFSANALTSSDRTRIAKVGFDLDMTDKFGRTLFTTEVDYGIPGIMGGLDRIDDKASRAGAGGKFVKTTFNLLRLHKLPFSSTILWKNQIQISPYKLPSSEQFQIGGIANVRGYPPAEVVGDDGYSMTFEWSAPVYPIPKNFKVPYSKAKLYDALRFVAFYDWANVHLNSTLAGEEKNKTLRGVGCGFRLNLPEDMSVRLEFAWPLDQKASDHKSLHTLGQFSKSF